ncbi:hypothetical protein ARMGADRAFT_1030251 [Armillaria gallica]|uniref:BTB domain-containing protein n=1 Tax=Armillaria gallica TaxID=47427 RepID=A0A2H3DX52_ARMGA|nr:hypothetical protein ARMGADRAFT_1030251 [Armillaria gallica]
MGTTEGPITTTADAPFNDPTDCVDLVIRTVDNVDFFVLSGLLSLKSPSSFFRQVLQGSHHTEERDGLPVLEVKEDSETFRLILLLCYPHAPPKIKSVVQLVAVGKALDKYFANGWKELGEAAAKNTLNVPPDSEVELEDLRRTDALQYVRLRDYPGVKTDVLLRPCSEIALDDNIIFEAAMDSISECKPDGWTNIASGQISQFAKLLAGEIDRMISQVPLNIEWTK